VPVVEELPAVVVEVPELCRGHIMPATARRGIGGSEPHGRASKRGKTQLELPLDLPTEHPPPGPATIEELFNWPVMIVQTLVSCPRRQERLLCSLGCGIHLSSSYSGMRTEELAAAALVLGVRQVVGGDACPADPFKFHSATDIAREC